MICSSLNEAKTKRNGPKHIYAVGVPCKYVVATPKKFWSKYMDKVDPADRNYFEVIEEDEPCHLYVDIDVDLTKYPSIDVNSVVQMVRRYIDPVLRDRFTIEQTIIAESNSEKKGSVHMIYHLKDHIWLNNANVGAFMRGIMEKRVRQNEADFATWSLFVDMCVYSRNRLFRMLGCTKPTDSRVKKIPGEPLSYRSWSNCKIQPLHTSDLEKIETPEPDGSAAAYKGQTRSMHGNNPGYLNVLKSYISENISSIRGMSYSPEYKSWLFNLHDRYCMFKGGTHGKNTIYILVDLDSITYTKRCWSMKYDCCKGSRTNAFNISDKSVIDSINAYRKKIFSIRKS